MRVLRSSLLRNNSSCMMMSTHFCIRLTRCFLCLVFFNSVYVHDDRMLSMDAAPKTLIPRYARIFMITLLWSYVCYLWIAYAYFNEADTVVCLIECISLTRFYASLAFTLNLFYLKFLISLIYYPNEHTLHACILMVVFFNPAWLLRLCLYCSNKHS